MGIDLYELIADRFGYTSSRQLTNDDVNELVKHFEDEGLEPKRTTKKGGFVPYKHGYQRKVWVLWDELGKAGVLEKKGDKSLQAYVRRMTKKSHLRFCGRADCDVLIESLKAWGQREKVDV